jgi:hypothetical protein
MGVLSSDTIRNGNPLIDGRAGNQTRARSMDVESASDHRSVGIVFERGVLLHIHSWSLKHSEGTQ